MRGFRAHLRTDDGRERPALGDRTVSVEKKKRGRKPGPVALRDCHVWIPETTWDRVSVLAEREKRSVSQMLSVILERDTEVSSGR